MKADEHVALPIMQLLLWEVFCMEGPWRAASCFGVKDGQRRACSDFIHMQYAFSMVPNVQAVAIRSVGQMYVSYFGVLRGRLGDPRMQRLVCAACRQRFLCLLQLIYLVNIHTCMYTYIHHCMHTYVHTYIYIYTVVKCLNSNYTKND